MDHDRVQEAVRLVDKKGKPITGNEISLSLKIVPNWLLPLKRVQP